MNDTVVPRDAAELNEALYNAIIESQRVGEQYSSQGAEYNGSQSAFCNISYNIFTQSLCPVSLLFCHNINQGMDVAGVPLFYATYSFGFGNNCLLRDLVTFKGLRQQKCGSFFLFLGSVTRRCLYLGSLNEGCKGWEGSRDNLYLGLLIKGQGIRNFVIWFIPVRYCRYSHHLPWEE